VENVQELVRRRFSYMRFRKALIYSAAFIVLLIVAAEAAFWLSGSDRVDGDLTHCAVLVPGYPSNSDGTPHAIQRFRVEAGIAAFKHYQCRAIIVSGGAVSNSYTEAETMAALAKSKGIPARELIVETHARSTWENVGCSRHYLENASAVLVVSDPLQAHRAKRYACRQDSHLCESFFAVGVNPPLTDFWWAVPLAANEVRIKIKDYLYEENATACAAAAK